MYIHIFDLEPSLIFNSHEMVELEPQHFDINLCNKKKKKCTTWSQSHLCNTKIPEIRVANDALLS